MVPGRGGGGYLGLPIFWRSALGLGLSHVAGGGGIDGHTTFQLAYALHFLRNAALGVTWAHIWEGSFAGTDTFDFGLSARVGRYVALGVTVEDVGQPHPLVFGATLPRLWTGELALRPLGTNRLEVALGAAHADGDAWERIVPRARLSARITDGLRVYGEGESVPAGDGAGVRRRQRHAARLRPGDRLRSPGRRARRPHLRARRRRRAPSGSPDACTWRRSGARRWGRPPTSRASASRRSTATAPSSRWCGGCARWRSIGRPSACCSRSRISTSATAASRSCAIWWRSCARAASGPSPT